MFSHVYIGVSDFDRSLEFYRALMACLGHTEKFCDLGRPWAGWHCAETERPLFVIGKPYDQQSHLAGNGQMTAFVTHKRELVDLAFSIALANGGLAEGSPGLRTEYHENYYGSYFRDPSGNKLCIVCHLPEVV